MTWPLILLIIFFILTMCIYQDNNTTKSLLAGFYEADNSFCAESGVDMFCIYIDDDVDMFNNRACYILMKKDDEFLINAPTVAKLSLQWKSRNNWWSSVTDPKYLNIKFNDFDEETTAIFPKLQEARFYPYCNKIVLYHGDTITFVGYKNPVSTELKYIVKDQKENKSSFQGDFNSLNDEEEIGEKGIDDIQIEEDDDEIDDE